MNRLLLLWLICGVSSCMSESSEKETPPNVIIIFTDDQGYEDVGCFGSPDIHTPHLDQMASQGIKLTQFYAAQAVCTASRAALMTGCYPNRLGISGAFMPNSQKGLNLAETTIAEMLKDEEYDTAIYGKWHLGDHPAFMPLHQGFDEYFGIPFSNDMWPLHPQQGSVFNFGPLPLYENDQIIDTLTDQSLLTTQITERGVSFIEQHQDRPFFLYIAHPQPHVPLFVSDKFKGKSERGLYGDVIMEIDWSVEQIWEALKAHRIEERTIIIFTSDNGPWLSYGEHAGSAGPLREGKGTAWEGGQREPTIVYYPEKIPAGQTIDVPMMNIDILPTIAQITGATLPEQKIDGKSVWEVWQGKSQKEPHEALFFYYKVNELHAVRYQNWKMYFPHSYRTLKGRAGGTDGMPVPYEQDILQEIELYDLAQDISESQNVAAQHPDIIEKISQLADKKREELGDNLLGIKGTDNRAAGFIDQ